MIHAFVRKLLLAFTVTWQGLDEVAIATIMHPVLLALEYVHKNGGIHRDVKVGSGSKQPLQQHLLLMQIQGGCGHSAEVRQGHLCC